MFVRGFNSLMLAVVAAALFLALVLGRGGALPAPRPAVADRVVFSAPVQIVLAAGDPYLAANFETIRVMATADDDPRNAAASASYRIRAHRVVAQLNPCNEDNYYVANAMLSWGGAPGEGLDVLRRAVACRRWDEFPAFFYGFNLWFFNRDAGAARAALEMAAERARDPHNAASMRNVGIMIEAGEFADGRAALTFLEHEREQVADERLREMLTKRIGRLQGLLTLREAQARYEALTGKALVQPQALLQEGILDAFPQDPLRLGYEFVDGHFRLREIRIPGMERMR